MTMLHYTQILSRYEFEYAVLDVVGLIEDELEHQIRSEAYRRKSLLVWPIDIHWIAERIPSFPEYGYAEPWEKGTPIPDWATWLRVIANAEIEERQ